MLRQGLAHRGRVHRAHRALLHRQVDEHQQVEERQALADEHEPAHAAVIAAPKRDEL